MRTLAIAVSGLLLSIPLFAGTNAVVVIHGQGVAANEFAVMCDFASHNVILPVQEISLEAAMLPAAATNQLKDAVAILQIVDTGMAAVTNSCGEQVALLDLKAIRDAYRITEKSSEEFKTGSYAREMMKEIGVLLGAKKGCPNPHCCMSEYQKEGILVLGRNYCPVCLGVLEARYDRQAGGEREITK